MAKVPTYNRQVTLSPLPSVRRTAFATPAAFGANEARELAQLAGGISNLGVAIAESQERADKAFVRDQLNQARSEARQLMGDIYQRKGEAAINSYSDAETGLLDIRKRYSENIKNDSMKEFFNASYDGLMNSHLDRGLSFQNQSRTEYEKMTLDAENENAIEDAAAAYTDAKEIEKAEDEIKANTNYANRGLSPELKQKAAENAVNNLHTRVLKAIVNDSPEAALAYLEDKWDKFNPTIREGLKKELKQKADVAWSENTANQMRVAGIPYGKQLEEAKKEKDPDRFKLLNREIMSNQKSQEEIRQLKTTEKINTESDKIYKDPFGYRLDVANFDSREQDYLWNLQRRLQNDLNAARGVGRKTTTNPETYVRLMSMPLDELRQEGTDGLMKHVTSLSSSDFQRVFNRFRDGDSTTPQMQVLKTYVGGIEDFNIKKEGDEASIRMGKLITEFQKQLDLIPPAQQTPEKVLDVVTKLLSPVSTDTGWFDGLGDKTIYRYEVPYLEERREQSLAYEQNIPENLKEYRNVNYDKGSQRYYVDGDNVRDVYDQYGNYIKSFRRKL